MSESAASHRIKKRRRVVFVSSSMLAALVAGGLVFAVVESIRDTADRAH
jgi:hypothetical protein